MQMYTQRAMDEYYKKQQDRDFYNQRMKAYNNEHVVGRAMENDAEAAHYRLQKLKPQFTADEQRIIEQYEKDIARKAEAEERDRFEKERNARLHAEQSEATRVAAKRQIVIERSEELQALRRAIQNATVSKANHEMIAEHIESTRRSRDAEKREENANLEAAEAAAREKDRIAFEKLKKLQEEAYNHMLQAAQDKERMKSAEFNETLRKEREMVQNIVAKALAEREKQIRDQQEKIARAKADMLEFAAQKQQLKDQERQQEADEQARIDRYNKEQEERLAERAKYNQYRQLAFDKLLNEMAQANKDRENRIRKLEDLRIQIAEFLEEEKAKNRDLAAREAAARLQEQMYADMQEARRLRANREAEKRAEEEKYKQEQMRKYEEGLAQERATKLQKQQAMLAYQKEMDEMLRIARERREQEEAAQLAEEQRQILHQGMDDEALDMIAQERARLVRECAAQVYDYLDQGVLTEDDLKLLPAEIQAKIADARANRALTKAGVPTAWSGSIAAVPDRTQLDAAKKDLEQKKRDYKCALPW